MPRPTISQQPLKNSDLLANVSAGGDLVRAKSNLCGKSHFHENEDVGRRKKGRYACF